MYQLFSHNDLDGVGCGIVFKLAFGNKAHTRYLPVNAIDYQVSLYLENEPAKDATLFITDLSVNKENEEKINEFVKKGGKVVLIDHHQTALHLNQYEWSHVVVQGEDGELTSATSLFYDYLVREKYLERTSAADEFVELVRQYDTWEWEINNNLKAKHLNDLFFLMAIDEFEERLLMLEEGKMERYIKRKNREIVRVFVDPYYAGVVHAESYISELGNALGKEHDYLDYIVILNMGSRKASFRTIHDHVDVSKIAAKWGGGGHAKASGCTLTEKFFKAYVKPSFKNEPIRQDAFRNEFNVKNSPQGCLYENHQEDQFFIYKNGQDKWIVEQNGVPWKENYPEFADAERQLKRKHAAWLVKDRYYVEYLRKKYLQLKKIRPKK